MKKGAINQIFDVGADIITDAYKKGGTLLSSNSAIKQSYDEVFGLAKMAKAYNGRGANANWLKDGIKSAYTKDGAINMTNVLGTAAIGAVGARAISGGGITKDSKGNTNIVALPFI